MAVNNELNPKLIDFVVERTHLKAEEIMPELKLAEDIGMCGLDGWIFFEHFFNEFNIKGLGNFDLDLHIDKSVDFKRDPLTWLKNLWYKDRRKYLRPDVTMGHLSEVIDSGIWFNER